MRNKNQQNHIGPLSANSAQIRHFSPPREDFALPVRVCNAAARGLYTGTVWNIRAGGEDHKLYPSRGLG